MLAFQDLRLIDLRRSGLFGAFTLDNFAAVFRLAGVLDGAAHHAAVLGGGHGRRRSASAWSPRWRCAGRSAGAAFVRASMLLPYVAPVVAVTFVWQTMLNPQFGIVNAVGTDVLRLGRPDRVPVAALGAPSPARDRRSRAGGPADRDGLRDLAVLPVRLPVPHRPASRRCPATWRRRRMVDGATRQPAVPLRRVPAAAADDRAAGRAAVHLDVQQVRRHLPAHRRRRRHPGGRACASTTCSPPAATSARRRRAGARAGRRSSWCCSACTSGSSAPGDRVTRTARSAYEHAARVAATTSRKRVFGVLRWVVIVVLVLVDAVARSTTWSCCRCAAGRGRCSAPALLWARSSSTLRPTSTVLTSTGRRRPGLPGVPAQQRDRRRARRWLFTLLVGDPRRVRDQPAGVLRPPAGQRAVPRASTCSRRSCWPCRCSCSSPRRPAGIAGRPGGGLRRADRAGLDLHAAQLLRDRPGEPGGGGGDRRRAPAGRSCGGSACRWRCRRSSRTRCTCS